MINPLLDIRTYGLPAIALAGGLVLGIAARQIAIPWLARLAAKSSFKYDDALVAAIRNPIVIWCTLIGLEIAEAALPLAPEVHAMSERAAYALLVISITWALARFGYLAVQTATIDEEHRGVSLIANLVRVAIGLLGLLVVLDMLDVRITPILTALGVGGLAIGLALQDTLANFFAGIRILVSRKIRPGDFLRLENGLEGRVHDITVSQTTLVQGANNIVIVPNAKLASAITQNFSLPAPAQNITVPFAVAFTSDLDKVEQITTQVAMEAMRDCTGTVADFDPLVRFDAITDKGIGVQVILRGADYGARGPIIHSFIKKLHARYRHEGLVLVGEYAPPIGVAPAVQKPPDH